MLRLSFVIAGPTRPTAPSVRPVLSSDPDQEMPSPVGVVAELLAPTEQYRILLPTKPGKAQS